MGRVDISKKILTFYATFQNNCKKLLFSFHHLTLRLYNIQTIKPIAKFQKYANSLVYWLPFWLKWLWCQSNLLSVREVALEAVQVDENVAMWTNLCRTTVFLMKHFRIYSCVWESWRKKAVRWSFIQLQQIGSAGAECDRRRYRQAKVEALPTDWRGKYYTRLVVNYSIP